MVNRVIGVKFTFTQNLGPSISVNKGRSIYVLVSLFAEEYLLVMKHAKFFFSRKKKFDPETFYHNSHNLR